MWRPIRLPLICLLLFAYNIRAQEESDEIITEVSLDASGSVEDSIDSRDRICILEKQKLIEETRSLVSELSEKEDLWSSKHETLSKEKEALSTVIDDLKAEVAMMKENLAAKDTEMAAKDTELAAKDAEIAAKDAEIVAKDAEIAAKDDEISTMGDEIHKLRVDANLKAEEIEEKVKELDEALAAERLRKSEESVGGAESSGEEMQKLVKQLEEAKISLENEEIKSSELDTKNAELQKKITSLDEKLLSLSSSKSEVELSQQCEIQSETCSLPDIDEEDISKFISTTMTSMRRLHSDLTRCKERIESQKSLGTSTRVQNNEHSETLQSLLSTLRELKSSQTEFLKENEGEKESDSKVRDDLPDISLDRVGKVIGEIEEVFTQFREEIQAPSEDQQVITAIESAIVQTYEDLVVLANGLQGLSGDSEKEISPVTKVVKRAFFVLLLVSVDLVLFLMFLPKGGRLLILLIILLWGWVSYLAFVAKFWKLFSLCACNCLLAACYLPNPNREEKIITIS